jgi:hypothetical protein
MNDNSFKIKITDVEIIGISKYLKLDTDIDLVIENTDAIIKYSLNTERREWGLKKIDCVIDELLFELNWSIDKELISENKLIELMKMENVIIDSYNNVIGTIFINSNKKFNNSLWDIEVETPFKKDGGFIINDVIINFGNNMIIIC